MVKLKLMSLKEIAVSPEIAALAKGALVKLGLGACDTAAIGVCVTSIAGLIQGIFAAAGAVLSVVYLYYRIKKIRRDK